ncbi:MAG: V-type ATP synthase subunit D [Deinococcales bacterium]
MAEQVAPTRSNLLQRRDQLRLANRGADLLKRKRDALIGEFFDLVKVSLAAVVRLAKSPKMPILVYF